MSKSDPFMSDLISRPDRPGVTLLVSTVVVVCLSMAFAFISARVGGAGVPEALGSATGNFLMAGVLALLLSIRPSWRTAVFRTKAVLICSAVLAFASLGNLAKVSANPAGRIVKIVNAVCPKTIGQDLVMNGSAVDPDGGVTITVQFAVASKKDIDPTMFREAVSEGSHLEAGSIPFLRQFVRSGHRLTYKFIDREALEIDSITIDANKLRK